MTGTDDYGYNGSQHLSFSTKSVLFLELPSLIIDPIEVFLIELQTWIAYNILYYLLYRVFKSYGKLKRSDIISKFASYDVQQTGPGSNSVCT